MEPEQPTCPRCRRPIEPPESATPTCRYCGWSEDAPRRAERRKNEPTRSGSASGAFAAGVSRLFSGTVRLALVFAVLSFAAIPFGGTGIPVVDDAADEAYEAVGSLSERAVEAGSPVAGGERPTVANGSNADANTNESDPAVDRAETERYVHRYINAKRTKRGLSPLRFDRDLREIARYYSARMATEEFFSHTAPDGETLSDRYDEFGYECRVSMGDGRIATGGENLAYTYYEVPVRTDDGVEFYDTERELARAVVDGWMHSKAHRENVLRPYWEREGIGIYVIEDEGRLRVYATEHFC